MRIVEPSFTVLFQEPREAIYKKIERIGRVCYKSEGKITDDSYLTFIAMIMKRRHYTLLEHVIVSVEWVVDRGVGNEMTRHRIASFAQESTIYCNYANDRFDKQIRVIAPNELLQPDTQKAFGLWKGSCALAEMTYMQLLEEKQPPAIARSVLPLCLATTLVSTFNLREWRHFFMMRADKVDHPLIRKMAGLCLSYFENWLPELFSNIQPYSTLKDGDAC